MRRRYSKRAEASTQFGLMQLIGIVLSFIVLVGLFTFLKGLYGLYFNLPDQGTQESFNKLVVAIEAAKSNGPVVPINDFYIDNGFKIVSFNKNQNVITQDCSLLFSKTEQKPLRCGSASCIVLCDEDGEKCRESPKAYKQFSDVDTITVDKSLASNHGVPENGKNPLAFYGKCWLSTSGIQQVYVKRSGSVITLYGKNPAGDKPSEMLTDTQAGARVEKFLDMELVGPQLTNRQAIISYCDADTKEGSINLYKTKLMESAHDAFQGTNLDAGILCPDTTSILLDGSPCSAPLSSIIPSQKGDIMVNYCVSS